LVGYQQSLEDKINAVGSISELEGIRFDIAGTINS
jgi:hypothetical protein